MRAPEPSDAALPSFERADLESEQSAWRPERAHAQKSRHHSACSASMSSPVQGTFKRAAYAARIYALAARAPRSSTRSCLRSCPFLSRGRRFAVPTRPHMPAGTSEASRPSMRVGRPFLSPRTVPLLVHLVLLACESFRQWRLSSKSQR